MGVLTIEVRNVRDVEAAMDGRQGRSANSIDEWEMHELGVEVDDVELSSKLNDALQHQEMRRQRLNGDLLEAQRAGGDGYQISARLRVATREERHRMTSSDELLGEV
jgi:hypothetical protein